MCKHEIKKMHFEIKYVLDKTQQICDKVILENEMMGL